MSIASNRSTTRRLRPQTMSIISSVAWLLSCFIFVTLCTVSVNGQEIDPLNEEVGTDSFRNRNLRRTDNNDNNPESRRRLPLLIFKAGNITSLELINTVTNTRLLTLQDGMILALDQFGLTKPSDFSVQVMTTAGSFLTVIGSLIFTLNNKVMIPENSPPYAMCGNMETDFWECAPMLLGTNTLVVTPYALANGKGNQGTPVSITFTIVQTGTASPQQPVPTSSAPILTTKQPTMAPVVTSAAPQQVQTCSIPKFEGEWENYQPYPIHVAEAQGALFGDEMVLLSGFTMGWNNITNLVFALDLSNPKTNSWREMDKVPLSPGLTHGASATIGMKYYICGGYVGGHPSAATELCFVYDHQAPAGTQWTSFPSLPEKRSGGAMWYDTKSNSLVYASGASRPYADNLHITIDHSDTWQITLGTPGAGWVKRTDSLYHGNHVGHVTVNYQGKAEHHYFVGGQYGEDELTSNLNTTSEYDCATNTWTALAPMSIKRGHFSESTIPYNNCGFFVVGGAINSRGKWPKRTNDITYYDITTNTWSHIGTLPVTVATPICKLHNGYIYCQGGLLTKPLSVRRKVVVA